MNSQHIKITKLSKISINRMINDFETGFNLNLFGISKKQMGNGATICFLGSGLPCHDKIPKPAAFESFTDDKDPVVDNLNISTVGTGLLTSENLGLVKESEIIYARIIDSKGQIFISSLISGILWACIKEANIIICPCNIQDNLLFYLKDIFKKIIERNMILVFPTEEENSEILKIDGILGVNTITNNCYKIEKKKNFIEVNMPKTNIYSTMGIDRYIKLNNRETGIFIVSSILSTIYSKHIKKGLNISFKNICANFSC